MFRTLLLTPILLALLASPALGQAGGPYEITRSTIDAGGSTVRPSASPEDKWLRGTIGQPDVGVTAQGAFYLAGGFWASQGRVGILFRDGFESGGTSLWSVTFIEASAPAAPPVATGVDLTAPLPASAEDPGEAE
ncbi:MAG: hypothetical protein AAGN66_22920 [Acidobacteriota bacterium]